MKPGIYFDIPNEDYHQGEGVSSSVVKRAADKTAEHAWASYFDPDREKSDPTPAMKIGTAIHTAVLEPDEYPKRYVILPAGLNRSTKDGKATYADLALVAEEAGAELIKAEDHATVQKAAASMARSPVWRKLHAQGIAEASFFWIDEETGVLCKIRPDWMTWDPHRGLDPRPDDAIVDLKSAIDASPDGFGRAAYNLGYYTSAAMYLEGFHRATGVRVDTFVWAGLEKEEPFAKAFYYPDSTGLEWGHKQFRKGLRTIADCMDSGKWPGYPQVLQPMGLPKWHKEEGA
jgi:hypothetical protein